MVPTHLQLFLTLMVATLQTLRPLLTKRLLAKLRTTACSLRLPEMITTSLRSKALTWRWVKASLATLVTLLTTRKQLLTRHLLAQPRTMVCSLKSMATTRTSLRMRVRFLQTLKRLLTRHLLAQRLTTVCSLKSMAMTRTSPPMLVRFRQMLVRFLRTLAQLAPTQVIFLTMRRPSLMKLLLVRQLTLVCSLKLTATTRTSPPTLPTLTTTNSVLLLLPLTWASTRLLLVPLTTCLRTLDTPDQTTLMRTLAW